GRVRLHPPDYSSLIEESRIFEMHHIDAGQQNDREQNVHEWPGDSDDEAVPPWMRQELCRIASALVHGVFATHLDVAAQRQSVQPIVGLATLESGQALSKADSELLDPYPKQLGCGI